MRALLPILIVAGLLVVSAPAAAGVKEGQRAPEFIGVKTNSGKKARLKELRGKVVVISFGASWCKPCKKELPALEKLAARFRKMRANVVFVVVNTDEEEEDGRDFLAGFKLRCVRTAFDPGQQTVGIYDPKPQPSTYILDQNGIVRHVHGGYHDGDENKIAAVVDKLLAK
jgi:peroxiredoxin